ncbi:hypothetical protein BCR34DRAFT_595424 [Clohesyomyces aquaticus]|uniref:DUF6594 domain-containing protein n=1 Tax=Clohesyomyces aquaticus TaxID=1231657 RepID=A0A1Y2AB05_9PLEO|nr:hypothetical protein BCR34DRAFT_595424 [Clohesyomyces aquaticus]
MQRLKHRFSTFYKDVAVYPEVANFRRYLEELSWIVYNDGLDVEKKRKEVNELIADVKGIPRGAQDVFTVTDWHPIDLQKENPFLIGKVESFKESVRQYCNDLYLGHKVAQLPEQSKVFGKRFQAFKNLFQDGLFGPTQEREGILRQVPAHADTCAWSNIPRQDLSTDFFVNHIESMSEWAKNRTPEWVKNRVPERWKKASDDAETAVSPSVALDTLATVVQILTCFYVPLYTALTLFILSLFQSTQVRFAFLALFSTIYAMMLALAEASLRRQELFTSVSQYVGVLGVFIGASSTNSTTH